MKRAAIILTLLILMGAFGVGVNRYLAGTTKVDQINDTAIARPTEYTTAADLPGTVFVVQRGQLFRLSGRHFTAVAQPPSGQWLQPASANDGNHMLAVLRGDQSSDVYLLNTEGVVVRRLTNNAAKQIDANHWVFWPRMSADGTRLFTSYDSPKSGFNVDLAVWSGSLEGKVFQHRWTTPNTYTGGDVHAVPTPTGGVIYSRYNIEGGKVFSQVVMQKTMASPAVPLSVAKDDCDQATLSPDGTALAMVCSQAKQSNRLVVAHLGDQRIDTQQVLVPECLCASPAWAPDSSGLTYLAPRDASGHFQLWWIAGALGSPQPTRRLTDNLDFDATSAPAWLTGPSAAGPQ